MPRLLFALLSLSLLAACGGGTVKETLGLKRSTPDEFRVVSRPALSVPPEFSLRPPAPGEEGGIAGISANERAAGLVLGGDNGAGIRGGALSSDTAVPVVTASELRGSADAAFLAQAGAAQADPAVRQKLAEETRADTLAKEQESWTEKLLPDKEELKGQPTVDADKEAERIRQNKDEGKPITAGATPEKTKKTSVLQHILGND